VGAAPFCDVQKGTLSIRVATVDASYLENKILGFTKTKSKPKEFERFSPAHPAKTTQGCGTHSLDYVGNQYRVGHPPRVLILLI
jgi:cell wall-associated NlpC family hydrolase